MMTHRRRRRHKFRSDYSLTGGMRIRKLNLLEVCEFRAAVMRAIAKRNVCCKEDERLASET